MTRQFSSLNTWLSEAALARRSLASAPLLAETRETLYRLTLPRALRHMTLQLGSLGDNAAITGLARMVVDRQHGAEAVNTRLGGSGAG